MADLAGRNGGHFWDRRFLVFAAYPMNELRIRDIIAHKLRGKIDLKDRATVDALRRAALLIASEALTAQQQAARTASMIGFSVTRGRTHL